MQTNRSPPPDKLETSRPEWMELAFPSIKPVARWTQPGKIKPDAVARAAELQAAAILCGIMARMRSRHQAPDFRAKRLRFASGLTRDFASLRLRSAACLSLVLACPATALADSLMPGFPGPFSFPSGMYPDRFASQGRPLLAEQSLNDPRYKFGLQTSDTYIVRQANGSWSDFSFPRRNWETNRVQDVRMNFGMLDDGLQLTMKQSHSFYAADWDYLLQQASKNKNSSIPGRFLAANAAEGD